MIRLSTVFFCLLLVAAAAGRYQAEAKVRAEKAAIDELEAEIEAEEAVISKLILEVEVLESGARLAELAKAELDLQPVAPAQLQDRDDLVRLVGLYEKTPPVRHRQQQEDFIKNAISLASLTSAD